MLHDKTWFLTLTPLLKNGSRAPDWKYSNDYRLTAPDSKTQLLVRQRHRSLDNSKTNHFICDLRVGQIADCNRKKSQLEQLSNLNYPFAFWANIFEKKCGQSSWFNSVFYHKAQMWMLFFERTLCMTDKQKPTNETYTWNAGFLFAISHFQPAIADFRIGTQIHWTNQIIGD